MLWLGLFIGLIIGAGAGLGTMYFATRRGLTKKVEDRIMDKMDEFKIGVDDIMKDVETLKDAKVGDVDDILKSIRDKVKDLL